MLRVLACFLDILPKCSEASLAHIVASYSEPMVLGVVTSVAVGLEGYGETEQSEVQVRTHLGFRVCLKAALVQSAWGSNANA